MLLYNLRFEITLAVSWDIQVNFSHGRGYGFRTVSVSAVFGFFVPVIIFRVAEMFIHFMCETEIALANTEFIGYSSPHMEAVKLLPEELKNSPIMYPSDEVLETTEIFQVLPEEIAQVMDRQWSDVRSYDVGGSSRYMIPIVLVLTVAVIVLILRSRAIKKFRDDY